MESTRNDRPRWPEIHVRSGSLAGRVFKLPRVPGHLEIGRQPGCGIQFDAQLDGRVSKLHARIEHRLDGIFLIDLMSRNGTLLNGREVEGAVQIDHGAQIQLGEGGPLLELRTPEPVLIAPTTVTQVGVHSSASPLEALSGPTGTVNLTNVPKFWEQAGVQPPTPSPGRSGQGQAPPPHGSSGQDAKAWSLWNDRTHNLPAEQVRAGASAFPPPPATAQPQPAGSRLPPGHATVPAPQPAGSRLPHANPVAPAPQPRPPQPDPRTTQPLTRPPQPDPRATQPLPRQPTPSPATNAPTQVLRGHPPVNPTASEPAPAVHTPPSPLAQVQASPAQPAAYPLPAASSWPDARTAPELREPPSPLSTPEAVEIGRGMREPTHRHAIAGEADRSRTSRNDGQNAPPLKREGSGERSLRPPIHPALVRDALAAALLLAMLCGLGIGLAFLTEGQAPAETGSAVR